MNLKLLNKIAIIAMACMLPILIFIGIRSNKRKERELVEDSRYTIGYAYKWRSQYRSGSDIYYSYQVNGVDFHTRQYSGISQRKLTGRRYFVKYYPPNPQNSRLLLEHPVPDWLKAPPNGWAEMPKLDLENKRIVE